MLLSLVLLLAPIAHAQLTASWTEPFPPHRIAGNLYYVGSKDLASYLIATPEGHLLINSSLEESVPLIRASVEKLGFKFADIKVLLISHAHSDHCAGSAEILQLTKAAYMVMAEDAPAVENGGTTKPRLGAKDYTQFPPAKVDRRLKDGEEVSLGGSTLVAHLTPGHTKGCTTWTMQVKDGDKLLNAVIIGSPNVNPGYVLVNNKSYPGIATDYEQTFRVLSALPVDLFLGAHGGYYGMVEKHAKLTAGAANPFLDAEGYHRYVAEKEQAFRAEWAKQKQAAGKGAASLQPVPDKLVVLTFDDSVASHATFVGPLLKKLGFGATFFITEGFEFAVDKVHYMTWEQIKALHEAGFEIGNHTRRHAGVAKQKPEALTADIEFIEQQCAKYGIPRPTSFCYPGYQSSEAAVKILQERGYAFARAGGAQAVDPAKDHPLTLPQAFDGKPEATLEQFKAAVALAKDGHPVVMTFHGVPDIKHPWVNTDPAKFESYMNHLKEQGCRVIAMRELGNYLPAANK